MDSVVLLHLMLRAASDSGFSLSALHVNHGLSPNAGEWQKFCATLCRALGVPFRAVKVSVRRKGGGLEAAARAARHAAFQKSGADVVVLAHHLGDQAETVLFNLLRGAGLAGASGMAMDSKRGRIRVVRPLLGTPRAALRAYAASHRLAWIEDESNDDESLTRNFLRKRVGPLLETRFPRWHESLARAARHFGKAEADANGLLREFLRGKGLKAPSEAKLIEMLKQLGTGKGAVAHDGTLLRVYRDRVSVTPDTPAPRPFRPRTWRGEASMTLPGGELSFRKVRGRGIDRRRLESAGLQVRQRSGGERLRPRAGGPSRTLKNLFQEAGVPPWERERMPLLYCGDDLVWAPALGVDASWRAPRNAAGLLPEWRPA
jgi:tRNA(Ile)-lysidine synthase